MRFNPCGAKVEVMRRCYRTRVKPFRDSDIEVGIRWYRAHDDAPTLPFPSFINSRDWLQEHTQPADLGEVWDAPRPFVPGEPIPAATGLHICGTEEDFRDGQEYNPDALPTAYRPDGLPLCCVDEFPGRVSLEVWPEAVVTGPKTRGYPVAMEVWPEAQVAKVNPRTGLVGLEIWPEARVDPPNPRTGLVGLEIWPEAQIVVVPLAPLDPDFCDLQITPLGTTIFYSISTPYYTGVMWLLDPGDYCLSVLCSDVSSSMDVRAYYGNDCRHAADNVLANANDPGHPWTDYGQNVPPVDGVGFYFYKSFTLTERVLVLLIVEPDDSAFEFRAKIVAGSCLIP